MAGDGGGLFSWTSLLLGIAGTAGVTVLGGLLALFYFQRALIYPSNVPAVRPRAVPPPLAPEPP